MAPSLDGAVDAAPRQPPEDHDRKSPPTNLLSFDLEHWYSATLLADAVEAPTVRIRDSVDIVLELLAAADVTATFFVVGEVAREFPDLVGRVADAGHEIASHGHSHRPLFDLDSASFRRELAASADAIERAVGERPLGFRAPNFSITRRTAWAFEELRAEGYRYDSSVFPVRTPMYGVSNAPIRPYGVRSASPFATDRDEPFAADGGEPSPADDLVEFPLAVLHPRVRIPTAGGFYARVLPTAVLARGIAALNRRGVPATLYFHPWEFNPEVPVEGVPAHKSFVSFHGIERTAEKLSSLLDRFEFGPFEDVLPTANPNAGRQTRFDGA